MQHQDVKQQTKDRRETVFFSSRKFSSMFLKILFGYVRYRTVCRLQ